MQYYYVIAEKRDGRTGTGKFRMVTTYHHNEFHDKPYQKPYRSRSLEAAKKRAKKEMRDFGGEDRYAHVCTADVALQIMADVAFSQTFLHSILFTEQVTSTVETPVPAWHAQFDPPSNVVAFARR